MITAVLDARCGLSVGPNDIYLNIAGGLRIVEPAADLAVAAALVSALTETPVPHDIVVFGEIALSGRVRPVAHADARLKEAAKLGFAEAWVPLRASPLRSARSGAGPQVQSKGSRRRRSGISANWSRACRRRRGAGIRPTQMPGNALPAGASSDDGDAMNWLDIGVVAIIVLSAVFAFARGFVREAFSVVAWGGAAVDHVSRFRVGLRPDRSPRPQSAAVAGHRRVRPVCRQPRRADDGDRHSGAHGARDRVFADRPHPRFRVRPGARRLPRMSRLSAARGGPAAERLAALAARTRKADRTSTKGPTCCGAFCPNP